MLLVNIDDVLEIVSTLKCFLSDVTNQTFNDYIFIVNFSINRVNFRSSNINCNNNEDAEEKVENNLH